MSSHFSRKQLLAALLAASRELSARKEEINRLNVFPVPDGDTGTNMSLTLESVVGNVSRLADGATTQEIRKAITNGALMGARGNSGVITSQILRGFCEGLAVTDELDTAGLSNAFQKAVEVAFQAVRKPVEGTILTVLKDSAIAARAANKKNLPIQKALLEVSKASADSVKRTPELLPVLKENGVVDAGGFGLSLIISAFAASLTGENGIVETFSFAQAAPKVEIEHINDWEGSRFRYCNEFLVDSDTLNRDEALDFLSTMGDCELCVGQNPKFKVHVHSNTPDKVLAYFLECGQISEVFIHNMQLQSETRNEKLKADRLPAQTPARKAVGCVAVAAGKGNAEILQKLGVDVVVSGGQTMNPSTKDILDAVERVGAEAVIVLPNNANIILAAQSAAKILDEKAESDKTLPSITCRVLPTVSVPQGFSAMLAFDKNASIDDNSEAMSAMMSGVKTGEVTFAIKDSKDAYDNPIHAGDVIGIAEGSIEKVGNDIAQVTLALLELMNAADSTTVTLLAGEDFSQESFEALVAVIEERYSAVEVVPYRGEQPLYPLVFSVE